MFKKIYLLKRLSVPQVAILDVLSYLFLFLDRTSWK